jgi:hypothetical protein
VCAQRKLGRPAKEAVQEENYKQRREERGLLGDTVYGLSRQASV